MANNLNQADKTTTKVWVFISKYKKVLIFIAIVAVIFILNHYLGWSGYITDKGNQQKFMQLVQQNYFVAILVYMLITVVGAVVLALPGLVFAILAGLMFGPWWGSFFCLLASTLGAMLAFLVGRFFLQDSLKPLVMRNNAIRKFLFSGRSENEIILLLVTRILPIFPYNLQNFAYGITDIGFGKYSLCTFFFMMPGVVLFTVGTVGVIDSSKRLLYLGIAFILLLLIILLGVFLKKKYTKPVDL